MLHLKRLLCVAILLCLGLSTPAQSQVSDATIQRLVDLYIQLDELNHLRETGQIDSKTYFDRATPIPDEINALWKPIPHLPLEERQRIVKRFESLYKPRIAALRARWQQESSAAPGQGSGPTQNRPKASSPPPQQPPSRFPISAAVVNRAGQIWSAVWGGVTRFFYAIVPILKILGVVFLIVVVLYGIGYLAGLSKEKDDKPPLTTNYGTAQYAPQQTDIPHPAFVMSGVFLGKSSAPELRGAPINGPGAPICSSPEHHTLIVARTGAGKGTRVIIPTLLRYAGSALVIDPKGENAAVSARVREIQLKQQVHIVNPWDVELDTFQALGLKSATYNPLDVLDRADPNAVSLAQALATNICPASSSAKDRYWQGSAAAILAGVFLWLTDQPGERKTLARAREIVSLSRKEFTDRFLIPMSASTAFSGAIREMVGAYLDLAQDTYSGITSTLTENTKFLSDPRMKAATQASSFSMTELLYANKGATVYLVIPHDLIPTHGAWLRLMLTAATHTLKRQIFGKPDRRCLFLIDEFGTLGRLDNLPADIAIMRGYGVDFTLIVQGLNQLKDHYGDARGTIIGNCTYKWFCDVTDLESAKYLSETLGKATVRTLSKSFSTGTTTAGRGESTREGESTTYGEMGRSLLTPDEVITLGRGVAIALQPEGPPHYLRPIDYWNLDTAFASLQRKYPQLYWDPPLRYDKNPYAPPGS